MKLAGILIFITVISMTYSEPQQIIKHIHFVIGGNGGSGVGGGGSNKPEEIAIIKPTIVRKIRIIPAGSIIMGGTGASKPSPGLTGKLINSGRNGAKAEIRSIIILLTKLVKAISLAPAPDIAAVIEITETILIELKKIVDIFPPQLKKTSYFHYIKNYNNTTTDQNRRDEINSNYLHGD